MMSRRGSLWLVLAGALMGAVLFGCGGGGSLADGGTPFGAGVGSLALRIAGGGVSSSRGASLTRAVPAAVTQFEIHVKDVVTDADLVPSVTVERPTGTTPITVTIENVPVGDVIVLVLGLDASGTALVGSRTLVTVEEGINAAVSLTPSPFSPSPSTSTSPDPTTAPTTGPTTAPSNFAVVANQFDNNLTSYFVADATGLLTAKNTAGTGQDPVALAVGGARNTIFAADQTAKTLSGFRFDQATGVMSLFDASYPRTTAGTPNDVVVEGDTNKFVFVATTLAATGIDIEGFEADATTGQFVRALPGTDVTGTPIAIRWLPPNYLIVATSTEVKTYTFDAGGGLTFKDASSVGTGTITAITVRPPTATRNFGIVYAAVDDTPGGHIDFFSIDPDPNAGTVGFIGSEAGPLQPSDIAADAGTGFVYVGSQASPTISILKADPTTGVLSVVGSFNLAGSTERVLALATAGAGGFLFGTLDAGQVETYRIDATTGALTVAGPRAGTGTHPGSILVF